MAFHVGQKVVCVDDKRQHVPWADPAEVAGKTIIQGRIYVVRSHGIFDGDYCITVEGIIRSSPFEDDAPFRASRFRPVAEKPSSIEIFRSLALDPNGPITPGGDEHDIRHVPADIEAFGGGRGAR